MTTAQFTLVHTFTLGLCAALLAIGLDFCFWRLFWSKFYNVTQSSAVFSGSTVSALEALATDKLRAWAFERVSELYARERLTAIVNPTMGEWILCSPMFWSAHDVYLALIALQFIAFLVIHCKTFVMCRLNSHCCTESGFLVLFMRWYLFPL